MAEHSSAPGDADPSNLPGNPDPSFRTRLVDVVKRVGDLGLFAFGGPPVHIQIFHRRFVDGAGGQPWLDEQTFQELFVLSQALPGPGSTKLLFNIVQVHAGVSCAVIALLLWILPVACIMYGLSLGVQRIGTTLPSPVYAFLSGLNAATVGGIALAAVQLSRKVITDRLTRAILLSSACAGLCYSAMWYYPTLIFGGGFATLLWDSRKSILAIFRRPGDESHGPGVGVNRDDDSLQTLERAEAPSRVNISKYSPSVTTGITLTVIVIVTFVALLVFRSILIAPPQLLAVFTNFYLAGCLIVGGGPVVTPLLWEYIVEPGWVSPRDFLLGLALIQAFPGPNFNFAVYLGSLALVGHGGSINTLLGALLGALGLFSPGILLAVGAQSGWHLIRSYPTVLSTLRGMNAAAVGLIYTAVYRLWQTGYLKTGHTGGAPLTDEPWWLAISAATYTSVEWFGVPIQLAIVTGGIAGLAWWDVVGSKS